MQHIILAIITMAIVRVAWVNFRKLGTLRSAGTELDHDQRHAQMTYATRIILCLIALAIAPFLFTILKP